LKHAPLGGERAPSASRPGSPRPPQAPGGPAGCPRTTLGIRSVIRGAARCATLRRRRA